MKNDNRGGKVSLAAEKDRRKFFNKGPGISVNSGTGFWRILNRPDSDISSGPIGRGQVHLAGTHFVVQLTHYFINAFLSHFLGNGNQFLVVNIPRVDQYHRL